MKEFLRTLTNIGINEDVLPWESHLIRKLNRMSLIGMLNMTAGVLFFIAIGYTEFVLDFAIAFFAFPIVFLLNKFKKYIWSSYWFFICGFCFFLSINLKMGKDSYLLLFYFPMIIGMVQLFGRKEMIKHLIVLGIICMLSISGIIIGFAYDFSNLHINSQLISNISYFNIFFAFTTTIGFALIVTSESISQENEIKKMLKEKEILLAEVFHRVKNNMNIVTSLLNLKKNMSDSMEVKSALEDCRNRVFSMALVHQNIFNNNDIIGLNFNDYIGNLVMEISKSIAERDKVEIVLETEDVTLDLANAIPCGLILNELITNSFKYAQIENQKLTIHVGLKKEKDSVELTVADNGPGMSRIIIEEKSLGIELIKSLSEQINGSCSFENQDGLLFKLKFKQ